MQNRADETLEEETSATKTVRAMCRMCNKTVAFNVPDIIRDHYPFSFIYYHGQPFHALITYIDKEYRVRGVEITKEFGGYINAPAGKYSKKCIVAGDWGVGKSSLIQLLVKNKFYEGYIPTITLVIQECLFVLTGQLSINVEFWETGGQRSSSNIQMRKKLFQEADTALILCDVSRPESFEVINELHEDIQKYAGPDCLIMGIANKVDIVDARKVTSKDVEEYQGLTGIPFYEVSLKERDNLDEFLTSWLYELSKTPQKAPLAY